MQRNSRDSCSGAGTRAGRRGLFLVFPLGRELSRRRPVAFEFVVTDEFEGSVHAASLTTEQGPLGSDDVEPIPQVAPGTFRGTVDLSSARMRRSDTLDLYVKTAPGSATLAGAFGFRLVD
eukprot:tig00020904_g15218.t1